MAFDTIAMLLGLAFGFAMVGSNLRGMLPHEYLFLRRKYKTARLFVYSSIICPGGHQQNPEKEKIDEKQNDKRTVPQGSFAYLHIRSSLKKITALDLVLLQNTCVQILPFHHKN